MDITERLRKGDDCGVCPIEWRHEAAEEIERLRAISAKGLSAGQLEMIGGYADRVREAAYLAAVAKGAAKKARLLAELNKGATELFARLTATSEYRKMPP